MKDKTALTARQKRFVEEYLACGDVVRCEIDGIGVLENRVKK